MKKIKANLYLEILKFEYEKSEEGFQVLDLIKHLNQNGFPNIQERSVSLQNILNSTTFLTSASSGYASEFRFINPDAYFGYLQYVQVMAAKESNRLAWMGVTIAIASTLLSVLISLLF